MTDDPKDLVPEILRTIRNDIAKVENRLVTTGNELHQDNRMLHERMSVFEKHMSALVSASVYQEERFATIEQRLHRLEARLNLVNSDTP